MSDVDEVKAGLGKRRPTYRRRDLLSSGCTLINLACSGHPDGAFLKGTYNFIVGDSASGKTWLTLQCLAEAAINPAFDGYRFIHDNVENGALMNMERYFGAGMAGRLEPPAGTRAAPQNSEIVENFCDNLDAAIKADTPFIYIVDSFDCLGSAYEDKKFAENRNARKKGGKEKGDYGDGKAKIFSRYIRRLPPRLKHTGSIVLGISQTRDDLKSLFGGSTHSGGRALKFYAALQMWTSVEGRIKKTVRDKPRVVGVNCRIAIKKNRLTGVERTVTVPIYYDYGMDNVGACIDYLIKEKHWGKKGGKLVAPEFEFTGTRDGLIKHIEDGGLQTDLAHAVRRVWFEIEKALGLGRPPRYG